MVSIKSRKLTEICLDEIKFDSGAEVHYVSFKYPASVAILPITTDRKILLVKQYRYPIKDYSWEIPAGGVAEDESPQNAVKRELLEETGYSAGKYVRIFSIHPSNGMSNEIIHIYKAIDLFQSDRKYHKELLENDMELNFFSSDELNSMIKEGEITDAATIIAVQSIIISHSEL
ncbi:MAG: NUDIX hydrolase [Candidatus Scalindua sp.]|jgi:ADP-ribose pyrophosphatase|nr:NUDIX hydrolase [Candidatus Scalindua sp.]